MKFSQILARKKGRIGAMAIKLDLEKHYDFLSWNYIKRCLEKFGFSPIWINRIMKCITSFSFFVVINGKAEGFFSPF